MSLVANAGSDVSCFVGEPVFLDGSASTGYATVSQTDGSWSTRWDTGDMDNSVALDVQNILKASHVYQKAGTYTATLTVKDSGGATSSDTATITVTDIPTATGGNTVTLTDSGNAATNQTNLQNAIDTAASNSATYRIIVPAGFQANSPITLPTRTATNYVTIEVANASTNLPVRTRATLANASNMFKVVARDASVSGDNYAFKMSRDTQYYRVIGMLVQRSGSGFINDMVAADSSAGTPTNQANHLIFDRVVIDGNGVEANRGFAPNGRYISLLNSTILDIKAAGNESKAIGYWDGEGPIGIINNRLEAASINFLLGGVSLTDSTAVSKGLVFRGNYSYKNPAWLGTYGIKNLWELKYGHNNICVGNVFENNYTDAQNGEGILVKSTVGDPAPYNEVRNVDFRNNKILNSRAGFNIAGLATDNTHSGTLPPAANHVRFFNNLFTQRPVSGDSLGNLVQGGDQVELIHNTFINLSATVVPSVWVLLAYGGDSTTGLATDVMDDFVLLNNIAQNQVTFNDIFTSDGIGTAGLNVHTNGYSVLKNIFPGEDSASYPANNFFPLSTGFNTTNYTDIAAGDYSLKTASAYHNAATDGTDIGADMTAIANATLTAVSGTWGAARVNRTHRILKIR